MSLFKKLFGKEKEPLKGSPITGYENEIHIKKIENYTEGNRYAYFHFPEFQNDIFCIEISKDEFTNSKSLKPHGIHSYMMDKVLMFSNQSKVFQLGLLYDKESIFITFGAYQKEIRFQVGDKVSLLFEDEEIWEIELTQKGYRVEKDSDGIVLESKEEISFDRLDKLSNVPLKKWKFFDIKNNQAHTNFLEMDKKRNILELGQMMTIGIKELV